MKVTAELSAEIDRLIPRCQSLDQNVHNVRQPVTVLWNENPCGILAKHFGITCCIHLQGSRIWRQQVSLKLGASPATRNDIQKTILLQYLRLLQRCCWRIVFSEMWRCVMGPAVPGVSRDSNDFTCKAPAWPWRWTRHSRSKRREIPVQWQSATSQMTWRVVVTADFSVQLRVLQIWSVLIRYGQYLRFHKERLCWIPYVVLSIRKSVRGCSVPTVLHISLFCHDTFITVMLRLYPLCEV